MAAVVDPEVLVLREQVVELEEKVELLRAALAAAMNQGVEMMVYEYKDRWADPQMVTAEDEASQRDLAGDLMGMKVAREVFPWSHLGLATDANPSGLAVSVLGDIVCSREFSYEELAAGQRGEMRRRHRSPIHFGAYLRARLLDMQVARKEGRHRGDYKSYEERRHYLREVAELTTKLEMG